MQDIFTTIAAYYHSVVDPLDPFNRGNIVLYFTWIVVYTFTGVAVWRSERSWLRFVCFVINQLFSIGILISGRGSNMVSLIAAARATLSRTCARFLLPLALLRPTSWWATPSAA